MKLRWSVVGLVCLGLVAALGAALLVAAVRAESRRRSQSNEPPQVEIVLAARALPPMAVVDGGAVVTQTIPLEEAPEDCVRNAAQVIGKVLAVPMACGQVFTKRCFVTAGSGPLMAAALTTGMRAVSISLSDSSMLAGLLYPGSVVDVLASFSASGNRGGQNREVVSVPLLQGVQVLAVEDQTVFTADLEKEQKASPLQAQKRRLVTLMVTPEQARALQLAMEHGSLSLAMRNPLDRASVDVEPMLISDILGSREDPAPSEQPPPAVKADTEPKVQVRIEPKTEPKTAPKVTPAVSLEKLAVEPPSPPRQWEVEVIRGAVVEKHSFDLPDEASVKPERTN